ncbi:extracellular ligand-binding receptor, partial [Rhizobium sp. Pop5]
DRNDVAVIARDAKAENIPLSILSGDAMRAANQPIALAEGVRAVALPEYALLREGTAAADALRAKGTEPEGYVLPSLAAALIAGQAAEAAVQAGEPLQETLLGTTFQTPVGPVAFTGGHELSQNPYRLLEWRGNGFFPPAAPTQ